MTKRNPADTAPALYALYRTLGADAAPAAILRMDAVHRPAMLATLSLDEVETLLEPAIIARDAAVLDQIADRWAEVTAGTYAEGAGARFRALADKRNAETA